MFCHIIMFIICIASFTIYASDKYQPFSVSKEDIKAVLEHPSVVSAQIAPTNADIAFIVADVKYNNGAFKFCECGDGIYMSLRAADITLNHKKNNVVSPYWGIFWHYLKQFNLPIWHVGDKGPANGLAMDELVRVGGKHIPGLKQLEHDTDFKKSCKKDFKPSSAIKDYRGIIVYRAVTEAKRDDAEIKKFKALHPEFLYVNNIARNHVKRKDRTFQAFYDAGLDSYIPKSKTYAKKLTHELIRTINNDFNDCDMLVVKPVFSSLSFGVNICAKKDLNPLLTKILRDTHTIKRSDHRCFSWWRFDKSANFVVASYEPSRTITKDGKSYDPTMRIVVLAHYDNGTIYTTPIAGFWKIPVKALSDPVSFTEKHVTIAHAGAYYSGILTDRKDWGTIDSILRTIMPPLYGAMLQNPIA